MDITIRDHKLTPLQHVSGSFFILVLLPPKTGTTGISTLVISNVKTARDVSRAGLSIELFGSLGIAEALKVALIFLAVPAARSLSVS